MRWKKLLTGVILCSLFLAGCGMTELPQTGYKEAPMAVNPERIESTESEEQIAAVDDTEVNSQESDSQEDSAEREPEQAETNDAEKLEFTIGNWDCLYGSWMDLEENAYTFLEDGSYTYTAYLSEDAEVGKYAVQTVDGRDYLTLLSSDGVEKRYELSLVRAGIGLYSTEEGKETELEAYLIAMM